MPPLTIRPASLSRGDADLFLDFWDSQIAWLANNGGADQWGTVPIRTARPEAIDKVLSWITRSETGTSWGPEWRRAFVAEVADENDERTPVASISLQSTPAKYVTDYLAEDDEPYVYVIWLMTNRDAGEAAKGVGGALIEYAKGVCREVGVRRMCLDCYRGNDRKLVK